MGGSPKGPKGPRGEGLCNPLIHPYPPEGQHMVQRGAIRSKAQDIPKYTPLPPHPPPRFPDPHKRMLPLAFAHAHPPSSHAPRDTVLALGGSQPPAEVFKLFRGRDPSTEAIVRHTGLTPVAAA